MIAGDLPLAGLRVVEFSHMVMGPSAGMILGDLGADVIKVEPWPGGDKTRQLPGAGAGFFPVFNRNKRSLAVDLKSPGGIALVRRLLATADVLTENFRTGALDDLGLGHAALSVDNPGLIYCSLKGFLAGPYETRTALDEVVQMMGGLAYMTGPPGRPLRAGSSVNDIMGGMFAVIGILAALAERARSGRGRHVRSALFENNLLLVAQHMAQSVITGRPAPPMPVRVSAWGVYDVFDSADGGQVFVGIVSDGQWQTFCRRFGRPDLAADPDLATNPGRVAGRARMMPALKALFGAMTRAEILAACEAAGLPFAPINRPEDLYDDPQVRAPGALVEVTLPDGRPLGVPALPLEMDGERLGLRLDVPKVGEHSRAIAREAGYSDAEIEALVRNGAIGPA
ncbi:CaiB/BaiF CoA transferase family protein [Prosthecomicrobium sp. N25]|uniref:CaiB/BaiF CoA transferase family protein n=1 Tax=Prosthecomicrobium sp. N25 TaxID=3129254 RepID=UPI0030776A26